MATTIKLKNGSGAPAASDLVQGEPALDLTNKRLYSENSSGTVIEIGTNPSSLDLGGTTITSTGAEINLLDGSTAGTVVNSKAVIYGSSGEVKGTTFQTATNTSGNLLIGNGTAFASTAVGDLSEISSVANDDVLLAIDTSGGGLKKITRSTLVSGLATSTGLSNIVEDTTPQLGGNLDTNSHNILIDDAHFIADENGNEQIIFQTTASAVNEIEITNAATGNGVQIASTGDDTNIDLKLTPKGTGQVVIDGNVGIETGLIDLKNGGTASQIKFYCESNNLHAQTLQSAPHSQGANNTLLLPYHSTSSTLVSDTATQTLTNKTLTSPKINEDVAVSATATELNVLDGITSTTAELNILDGVTSTTAELNILDGVTSTATELNYLDITTLGTSEASKAVTADSNAKVKFIGTTSVAEMIEKVTIQTSTTGTINFDFLTQAVEFYTANQGSNRTINFRGDSSNSLNSIMAIGESMTAAVLMTQGSTAYLLNSYQIDGSDVSPEWSGGSQPSDGNSSSIDVYVFTIIKTADATFTVLASQSQYA